MKNRRYPASAMLPNKWHPSVGCSCRECLWKFPVSEAFEELQDHLTELVAAVRKRCQSKA